MKHLLVLLLLIASVRLPAQIDSATMIKIYMEYMTPNDMHTMLAKYDGQWDADITMWVAPDTAPVKSAGTTINRMILGGRYQEATNTSDMMGMPFEGVGIMAYDNLKKIFINTWIDNMGTGILVMEGTWYAATKTISLKGKTTDPLTQKECDIRQTFRFIDDDHLTLEMYAPNPATGKEYKNMEIKYTRKK